MKKEKVFIILSHKNMLKEGSHPGRNNKDKLEWEVSEQVEFVNQLRNRHTSTSSAIGDYINRKMVTGSRFGLTDYEAFEQYVRKKYAKQMAELDAAYNDDRVKEEETQEVFVDNFGNVREKTVFDV